MIKEDLLLELGTEELPPKALRKLAQALCDNFKSSLDSSAIEYENIKWYATPRRLALKVTNISDTQPDKTIVKKGPSVSVAFDADNNPTKVGLAWANSNGITLDQAEREQTPKGEWLIYKCVEKGGKTADLIPTFFAKALANLPIPKMMRWSDKKELFVRPVHTLTMLMGDKLIPGTILGLESSNILQGHRFMGEQFITINNVNEYPEILETKGMVIADYDRRKAMIIDSIEAESKKLNGQADMDDDLIEEVTSLVEYPVLLTAKFEEKFLAVPSEALVHTMKGDQKYFPVYRDGKLLPNFIFISNIISEHPEHVIAGNERVVRPRLSDAEFFFNTDKKKTLFSRFDSLKNIVFQKQLGTLAEKSEIVAKVAEAIAKNINTNSDYAYRAGILSKCDLITNMVSEFTDTQGIMGMHYARIDGEPEEIALAMNEQYMPRFAGDNLPTSLVSCAVSIAEKIVTLVGIFGINLLPKGDKDPYALRRASIGLIRILIEKKIDLDIKPIISLAKDLFGEKLTNKTVEEDVITYIQGRFKAYYQESNIENDSVQAVLANSITNILDFDQRVKAVLEFKTFEEAETLSAANKRVSNIIAKKATPFATVSKDLLEHESEIVLYNTVSTISESVTPLFSNREYKEAFKQMTALAKPLTDFFENVLVNCENESVKENRYALLKQIQDLFLHIADISVLQK